MAQPLNLREDTLGSNPPRISGSQEKRYFDADAARYRHDVYSMEHRLSEHIPEAQKERLVLAALDDQRSIWRTISGIASDTTLSLGEVTSILTRLAEEKKVVKSTKLSSDGLELFASRKRFREQGSIAERVLSAIRNRAP